MSKATQTQQQASLTEQVLPSLLDQAISATKHNRAFLR